MRLLEAQHYSDGKFAMLFRPGAEDTHMHAIMYAVADHTYWNGISYSHDAELISPTDPEDTN